MASQLVQRYDQGLVVDAEAADRAVAEQLYRTDAVDQYGAITLFVESWSSEPTYVGALALVEEFNLPYPRTETELEKEYPAVYALFDQLSETLTNRVIRQLNAASHLTKIGGIYAVGQNNRDFGLQFSASLDELVELQREVPLKTASTNSAVAGCIERALQHLRQADFGRPKEAVHHLTAALDVLEKCGVDSRDIKLSLKSITMDSEKARNFIYGPSGRGSNRGAIVDLTDQLDQMRNGVSTQELRVSTPRIIIVGGLRYERVDDAAEVTRIITAAGKKKTSKDTGKKSGKGSNKKKRYTGKLPGNRTKGTKRTPKQMDGVMLCKSKDHNDTDPKRKAKEQVWCTYDSRGKLRGRHPSKEKAINHKLMLINIYWTWGKGRDTPNRPRNKPIKPGKPPKKWGGGKK